MPSEYTLLFISTIIEVFVLAFVGYEVVMGEIRHRRAVAAASTDGPPITTEPRLITMRLGLFIIFVSGLIWAAIVIAYDAVPKQTVNSANGTAPVSKLRADIQVLTNERDQAIRERDALTAREGSLESQSLKIRPIGPINMSNAFSASESLWKQLINNDTALLVSATKGHARKLTKLNNILSIGTYNIRNKLAGKNLILSLPNKSDLDAPDLEPMHSGIVIHGGTQIIRNIFSNILQDMCFIAPRFTEEVPNSIKKYYKREKIFWIEIGHGPIVNLLRDCSE